MKHGIRVLFLGDVVGPLGRHMVQKHLHALRQKYEIDAVVLNGENSADGKGITPRIARFFRQHKVDVITTGNHIWAKKEIYQYLNENKDILRPANFPSSCPGTGVTTITLGSGHTMGIINLQGRVFMHQHVDCPFRTAESLLTYLKTKTSLIFVDFHAETTSEKMGLACFLDGKVSGIVGTHTHVQTADERILPKGTAFITDIGMSGALNSMIGMQIEPIVATFLTQMPHRFLVEQQGPALLTGVWIEADPNTGRAHTIERIKIIDQEIQATLTEDGL
jgi:metallophosphoesterase (TIGR00282 family)